MILARSLAAALVLVASAGTAGCTAAASAALGVALNIAVKATELDTAVIENLRARQSRTAVPPTIAR
ncbi:MAG TPA: hypothetical protein VKB68_09315 [Stellaceae bacterium]|nr:hypothetical protein [Stellaceae bacterium]